MWLQWWAEDKEFASSVEMCTIFGLFFVAAIFDEKFARKDGCGWAEEEEEPFPREFGLIPPIKSFSRPPRSFLNLLVSVSEVYRGDENFLHRRKQKLRTAPILRWGGWSSPN